MIKAFLATLMMILFPLISCAQPLEQVLGAWRAVERDPESGQIFTFVLTDKTLDQGIGSPEPVALVLKDKTVVIQKAGTNRVIGMLDLIDKDTLVFSVPLSGDDVKFIRATEADIQTIRAAEGKK
ncbi:MAG: hypothetical protein LBC79_01385 [Deltaproteobacteria bacterium]|jgi:hypothetical protein|nr:hypothetical protein [Deltaproteobacteria bacterium]